MSKNNGFTLVEVVVVVVILSILAVMLIPKMTGFLVKGSDEQDQDDAKAILDSAQAEFYELYSVNAHDGNYKSIIQGDGNKNPNVNTFQYTINDSDNNSKTVDIKIVDVKNNRKYYPIITEIFRNIGYKVKTDPSTGVWKSDVPCWVMVITGDYDTYCNPEKDTYCPEKAYTVYGVIFNKNVRGRFFIMQRDGKIVTYPSSPEEFDKAIDSIIDDDDPEKPLLKQIYILKANWPDNSYGSQMWSLFHNKLSGTEQNYIRDSYKKNK